MWAQLLWTGFWKRLSGDATTRGGNEVRLLQQDISGEQQLPQNKDIL